MALTATATMATRNLLTSLLNNPVNEVTSVNKPNISLHAYDVTHLPKNGSKTYVLLLYCVTPLLQYLGTPSYYSDMANHLTDLIDKQRAVVYTDFVKDVAPLAIALREKGLQSWSYHGKNMSSHDKVKAVREWCPEDSTIQVCFLVAIFLDSYRKDLCTGHGLHISFWDGN